MVHLALDHLFSPKATAHLSPWGWESWETPLTSTVLGHPYTHSAPVH